MEFLIWGHYMFHITRKLLVNADLLLWGANMIFYALIFAGPWGRCWNLSLKGKGFDTSQGAKQMLVYKKSMFDRCYCIKTFCCLKTSEKSFEKFFFPVPTMGRKSMLPVNVLKMLLPGQRLTSSWDHEITFVTVHVTNDDVSFCDGPGMINLKTAKPCINSMWIALLIHGFVQVKTWLLTACDTAFYAIIPVKESLIFTKSRIATFCLHACNRFLGDSYISA